MKVKAALFASLLALGAGLMTSPTPVLARTYVDVQIGPPPPPRYERLPPRRYGYVWSPGYWAWDGYQYVWVRGGWVRVRPGYRYYAPHWERGERDRWEFRERRWER
ncbi:hypothetical protein [Paraherbaspirillum soli]|uniref:YXWGXW repeat-containing protein n=1 Tax=Paraherbaspirillum soli TaxID=631222 RepID=A0ABW0M2G0_9BURK